MCLPCRCLSLLCKTVFSASECVFWCFLCSRSQWVLGQHGFCRLAGLQTAEINQESNCQRLPAVFTATDATSTASLPVLFLFLHLFLYWWQLLTTLTNTPVTRIVLKNWHGKYCSIYICDIFINFQLQKSIFWKTVVSYNLLCFSVST